MGPLVVVVVVAARWSGIDGATSGRCEIALGWLSTIPRIVDLPSLKCISCVSRACSPFCRGLANHTNSRISAYTRIEMKPTGVMIPPHPLLCRSTEADPCRCLYAHVDTCLDNRLSEKCPPIQQGPPSCL